ncbi:related to glyoxalase family protein [Cephalotrichum gorgonifer]|uniref:Related to glyoxalase family protein n=1 Tax=Cephalotrichum gorgonifer TaxID=2041049 RepID=A0AAE8STS8_9PEZI|nr:related to glyoxalase family protein [Cephalotrichum gorgonifer]
MTISHTGIIVTKAALADVTAWYLKALAPLGYKKVYDTEGVSVGLGDKENDADWYITVKEGPAAPGSHTAFAVDNRASVDAFYKAALADAEVTGAKDNGPPGVRADYHSNYYAAFVIDPVGNNIEVLCEVDPEE